MVANNPYLVPRDLVARYNTRGPRYTSYPTALEWDRALTGEEVADLLQTNRRTRGDIPLSVYVHIPFCVKLCYYCACNRKITSREETVTEYLDAIYREIDRWCAQVGPDREVVQIHWGGGTPTHLTPGQIEAVAGALLKAFSVAPGAEISVEVHPTVTTSDHLAALRRMGFNRVSMGVQDFDPKVQEAVNRPQTYELTRDLIQSARALGFESVNVDLIYGLPFQSRQGFARTLDLIDTLSPDRIALFNYAHVPNIQPGQRMIDAATLPAPDEKLDIFEAAVDRFVGWGYRYIGMDHFARPEDELSRAQDDRTLRRNFMGYTTCADSDLIGIGMSSISDLDTCYLQNHRGLRDYVSAITDGNTPVVRGMVLTDEDRLRRDVINRLICHCGLDVAEIETRWGIDFNAHFAAELAELTPLAEDGLVDLRPDGITVTPRGQMLLRNVCMPFDAYLRGRLAQGGAFSRTL